MMRRWIFAVPLVLAACQPEWDGQGIVTGGVYDDPDTWTEQVCRMRDDKGTCTVWDVERHHDPAHWIVIVTDADGREHRVEVSHRTYAACSLGDRWGAPPWGPACYRPERLPLER